ncbi:hypothetical protein SCACP_36480 [Sporomusa carbonis]|uniref:UPF0236 family transposase-like protein n=1 Tax=Sporomusa carbonis TaxID=3076075 RepID=UPI003A6CD8B2
MFRKNQAHQQDRLFSHYHDLDPRLKKRLQTTWAPVFYKHVFCQIDEESFAQLYCSDNGRPSFPVNILLALEFIKHWKDLTDEELLEQASFNYQVAFAIGLKDLGEEYVAPRTLYEFRERVYRHVLEHGKAGDLIFKQFTKLTDHFFKLTGAQTNEQRMDFTFVSSNIQKAGRLALAFDVLFHAVKSCPEEILPEAFKTVLTPSFKTTLLYKNKASGLQSRLEELLKLGYELLLLVKEHKEIASSEVRREITKQVLEELDQQIKNDKRKRSGWQVCRTGDSKEIVTCFGAVSYKRTYYRHKETGEYAYLVDKQVGYTNHMRVDNNVKAKLVACAGEIAYRKSAQKVAQECRGVTVSGQTVLHAA